MAYSCKKISSDNIIRSPLPDILIPTKSLPEIIWSNVEKYADYPAVTCGISGRSYSFKEARALSRRFGAALLKRGFQPGDVLAVMLPNIPEYALILMGALEAGLIVATINSTCKCDEIYHIVKATGAKIMLTLPSLVSIVYGVMKELNRVMRIITVSYDEGKVTDEEVDDFQDMISGNIEPEFGIGTQSEDIAFLFCTSGTGGTCKIVTRTHKSIIACLMQQRTLSGSHSCQMEHSMVEENQSVTIIALASGFIYMILCLLRGLAMNAHTITLPKWEPRSFLSTISNQKPLTVTLPCIPALIFGLQSIAKTEDLKPVRNVLNINDFATPSHIENLLKKMPNWKDIVFCNGYGTAETLIVCARVLNPASFNPEMVGFLCPNTQVRIVSPCGKNLGPREEGEICVRGPQVSKGYFNDDKATAEAFDKDGWFKTGDLGYYDETCALYIKGRLKEIIKVEGITISPAEIERVLLGHPGVIEAAVIGVPANQGKGENIVAYVVPKSDSHLDCDKISAFVAEQVASHKRLSKIIVRSSLPKNTNGKVLKHALKEEFLKGN